MGRAAPLPDGLGTVTFDGVSRYVKLQVSHTPGQLIALAGVVLALIGLLASLFIRPRRIWVRARAEGGRTLVEVGGLDRSAGGDLSGEIEGLVAALSSSSGPSIPDTPARPQERARDPRAVRGAQQPGGRRVRGGLLPRRARPPRPVGRGAHGRGARRRTPVAEPVAVCAGGVARPERVGRRGRAESERMQLFGRVGVALTVVAVGRAPRRRGRPGSRRRPGAGALGQHVRVHPDRHLVVGHRLPDALPPLLALLALPGGHRLRAGHLDDRRAAALHAGGAAARRAAVAVAGDPRGRRDHRHRGVHHSAACARRSTWSRSAGSDGRPRRRGTWAATSPGCPTLEVLDRIAYRTHAFAFPIWTFAALIAGPHLGALRLGPLLGLGPQGDLGLHHLGRVRRLPARPRHVGLEGPLGGRGRR